MFSDVFVSVCVVVFVIGITIIWRSSRRRVTDGSRHCRRCGYRVDQSPSEFCSECGMLITERTVIHGRREPAYLPMAAAALFAIPAFLLFAMSVTMQIRGTDLMPLMPTWYLMRADVSREGEFGNEQTAVLRTRQLNGDLPEDRELQLSDFLARRALSLTRDNFQRNPNFTIHTLTMFQKYKPSQPLLDEYLNAVIHNEHEQGTIVARDSSDGLIILHIPRYHTSSAFYDFTTTPLALTWRQEILEVRQGETRLTQRATSESGIPGSFWEGYRSGGGAIVVRARIRWYIEPATSEKTRALTTSPWHVMETAYELRPEA